MLGGARPWACTFHVCLHAESTRHTRTHKQTQHGCINCTLVLEFMYNDLYKQDRYKHSLTTYTFSYNHTRISFTVSASNNTIKVVCVYIVNQITALQTFIENSLSQSLFHEPS